MHGPIHPQCIHSIHDHSFKLSLLVFASAFMIGPCSCPCFNFLFALKLYVVVIDNLKVFPKKNYLASLASHSPSLDTTSTSKSLHIDIIFLFLYALTFIWFVTFSLASTKYFIYHNPIGLMTRSSIHL